MIYGKYIGPFHPGCPVTTSEFSDISNKHDLIVHKLLYKIMLQYEQEKKNGNKMVWLCFQLI
jgi:hypothetical protein